MILCRIQDGQHDARPRGEISTGTVTGQSFGARSNCFLELDQRDVKGRPFIVQQHGQAEKMGDVNATALTGGVLSYWCQDVASKMPGEMTGLTFLGDLGLCSWFVRCR